MMTVKICKKTVAFKFDGFADAHNCYMQGEFCGTFYVPIEHVHMIDVNDHPLTELKLMHDSGKYGIYFKGKRYIK